MSIEHGGTFYTNSIEPLLQGRDSETWHVRAREALHHAEANPLTLRLLELLAYKHRRFTDPRLNVFLGGQEVFLDNPVMVGAGWDKVGRAVQALYTLGFSGVEVGSVLRHPQPGNKQPRQFMIGPGVCMNRLGFNSPGMKVVARNLESYRNSKVPIGISLGKNADVPAIEAPEAHAIVAQHLYEHASYFAINVSSPNTQGLRELQARKFLTDIVQAVNGAMDSMGGRIPLYIKVAPELTDAELDDVIDVVLIEKATGIIAVNTTNNPAIKAKYGAEWADQMGGVSGADEDYRNLATEKVAHIDRITNGKMEIIAVGGIDTAEEAWRRILAGARVVQLVTGLRSRGPSVAGQINHGLIQIMNREGIHHISEAVGRRNR